MRMLHAPISGSSCTEVLLSELKIIYAVSILFSSIFFYFLIVIVK